MVFKMKTVRKNIKTWVREEFYSIKKRVYLLNCCCGSRQKKIRVLETVEKELNQEVMDELNSILNQKETLWKGLKLIG